MLNFSIWNHLWFLVQTGYWKPCIIVQLNSAHSCESFSRIFTTFDLQSCSSTHHLRYCVKDACFRVPRARFVLRTSRRILLLLVNRWLFLIIFVRTNSSFLTWFSLVTPVSFPLGCAPPCARNVLRVTISSFINRLSIVNTGLLSI